MMVNGTNFRIQQKGVVNKGNAWGSHKYAGKSALRNELGIDIPKGNLVWVEGPYPTGTWPDIKIFLNCIIGHLLPGKCVKANNGYVGHPDKIKCPNNDCNQREISGYRQMQGHATRPSMATSRTGGSVRGPIAMTSRCMGQCSPLVQ
jgi:hypothetical protein